MSKVRIPEPPMNTNQLAPMFGYANRRGVIRAINNGSFPIPTYMFDGRRYAHPDHVRGWLDARKVEAQEEHDSWVEKYEYEE